MIYSILKFPAQIAIWFYCRNVSVNQKKHLHSNGPLLIAANHPNSFLDAIILASLFDKPVYSLARGDAFSNKFLASILRATKILPVYRLSEGAENLEHNYKTFDACKEIFKKNGIVLIFSEGLCVNEWHLRPLKKGTARLALSCWQDGIPLTVLPLGINYSSFKSFGKNVQLNFGNLMRQDEMITDANFGQKISSFNHTLQTQLAQLVVELDKQDVLNIKKQFLIEISPVKKMVLAIPALIGKFIHFPLYFPVNAYVKNKMQKSDHYDSVLVGLLFIIYPFYLLLCTGLIYMFFGMVWASACFILMPFFSWCTLQLKKQF